MQQTMIKSRNAEIQVQDNLFDDSSVQITIRIGDSTVEVFTNTWQNEIAIWPGPRAAGLNPHVTVEGDDVRVSYPTPLPASQSPP